MIGYKESGSVETFESNSEAVKIAQGGSTGVLMSTLWNQYGVANVGNNTTVTYNEYCPTSGSTHTLTGCTNTAAGQLIYYFIEKYGLDLQLTLSVKDEYTSVMEDENLTIQIKADGSTPGTLSFDKINEMLADFDIKSAADTSALVYACGVVQQASYGVDGTATAWKESVFTRAGLQSVNSVQLYWPTGYYWGSFDDSGDEVVYTISDGAWEVLIENLQAGAPVGTSYPGHALIIDGYNADDDTFHINFGWGNYSKHFDSEENLYQGTGWYTREEMIAQQYYEFIYDLSLNPDTTFTVNDADLYGTGTLLRAFERANGAVGDNNVVFDDVVDGKSVELLDRVNLDGNIQVSNYNMNVKVTGCISSNWGDGFYLKNNAAADFEDFSGALIVNTDGYSNVAFGASSSSGGDFSINTNGALIYGGGYAVDSDYSAGADAVFSAMSDYMENGGKLADFAVKASQSAYSFSIGSGDDTIVLDNKTLCLGNMKLHGGTDTLTVTNGSEFYGDVYDCETITIDSTSQITGVIKNKTDLNLVLKEENSAKAMLKITSELSYMASRLVNITVNVADAVNTVYTLLDASGLKGADTYLAGLVFTITGSGKDDFDLSLSGTAANEYAELTFNNGVYALQLQLDDIKAPTVPGDLTAEVSNNSVVLDWSDAVDNYGVVGYEYRFGTAALLDTAEVFSAAESTAALANLSNGTYYFQVRAYDEAGNCSDWSEVQSFEIDYVFSPVTVVSSGIVTDYGESMYGKNLLENDIMHVSSGGYVENTVIDAGGMMNVSGGALASNTTVKVSGNMIVVSGGSAADTVIDGGVMSVRRGGQAIGIELLNGDFTVFGGAGVSSVTVSSGAVLQLAANGAASDVTVMAGGVFNGFTMQNDTSFDSLDMFFDISDVSVLNSAVVSSGAAAGNVDVKANATLYVQAGGSASVAFNPWGGNVVSANGAFLEYQQRQANVYYGSYESGIIQSGDVLADLQVASGEEVMVYSGGLLSASVLTDGGTAIVNIGGAAENIDVQSGGSAVISGGRVTGLTAQGGAVYALDGAEIADVELSGNAVLYHSSGLIESAVAANSAVAAVYDNITSLAVNSGGRTMIYNGGRVENLTGENGSMFVYANGALGAVELAGGSLEMKSAAVADSIAAASGAKVQIAAGVQIADMQITDGAAAVINKDAVVSALNVEGAQVTLNGVASSVNIADGGVLQLRSGGVAADMQIVSGGTLNAANNAKLTGVMTFEDGASVTVATGTVLEFDLTNRICEDVAIINDLAVISGYPVYTVIVTADLAAGEYKLAAGADRFNSTITVGDGENIYGTLSVNGEALLYESRYYTLSNVDGNLNLTITGETPEPVPPAAENLFFAGNFDGGSAELLGVVKGNAFSIWQGDTLWYGGKLPEEWTIAGAGDFNGDGTAEILYKHASGLVTADTIHVSGEAPDKEIGIDSVVLNSVGENWSMLGVGDFNADGADDILVANPQAAKSSNGDVGLFGYWANGKDWQLIGGYDPQWQMLDAGDYDGDGQADVLFSNSFEGADGLTYQAYCTWIVDNVNSWRMVSVANPEEWNYLGSGDFDGDSCADIAMINKEGTVGIWGVKNGVLDSWSILSAVNTFEWKFAGVGDFNGDGTDDIAWCSSDNGLTGYWQVENKQLSSWNTIGLVG
ncbi:MAG: hypothetical protein E7052_04285 [Lentisphaerae bacterium]|nr:hypothetical protein [Lentisphaerota bacterium]